MSHVTRNRSRRIEEPSFPCCRTVGSVALAVLIACLVSLKVLYFSCNRGMNSTPVVAVSTDFPAVARDGPPSRSQSISSASPSAFGVVQKGSLLRRLASRPPEEPQRPSASLSVTQWRNRIRVEAEEELRRAEHQKEESGEPGGIAVHEEQLHTSWERMMSLRRTRSQKAEVVFSFHVLFLGTAVSGFLVSFSSSFASSVVHSKPPSTPGRGVKRKASRSKEEEKSDDDEEPAVEWTVTKEVKRVFEERFADTALTDLNKEQLLGLLVEPYDIPVRQLSVTPKSAPKCKGTDA
ncbi:UNVERIFIED_CONTAM: transmembrane protein, putative [Hammondia hammondi]|eukprot:XP_008883204.1 transmembrane protein, putative [Hammondia hammondi]